MSTKAKKDRPAIVNPLGVRLTTHEAAAYLGLTLRQLRRLIEQRKIRVLRDGGELGIYEAWLTEYLERYASAVVDPNRHEVEPDAYHPTGIDDLVREARTRVPAKLLRAKAS